MPYMMQHTLKRTAKLSDIGLHSGKQINMVLRPAKEDTGIVFVRSDLKKGENVIPALWDQVVDTKLCTVIGNNHGATIGTIEHLMSALRGCGVDNVVIEIDGAEVPAVDGSAMPFVNLIESVGKQTQNVPRRIIRVLKDVTVIDGDKSVTLRPDESSTFSGTIEFDHDEIGTQTFSTQLVNGNFKHDIAEARTFGFFHEAEWLRSQGLGLGGSLDNAIILDHDGVMNPNGLRFKNEFIRHKLLDAIGDLYLAGGQILGLYDGTKAGHAINNAILHELFSDNSNWEYVDMPLIKSKSVSKCKDTELVA